MFCAISGEIPQLPVVSKSNGMLYEKRLIEKYIQEEGKCPVTGSNISVEDLIQIQCKLHIKSCFRLIYNICNINRNIQANKAVRPRPITGTSIPGLIASFQNEWDEVMLETFTLKQHLDITRQELAQSLYQHDAACRVIARLMQERDEARQLLNTMQVQSTATGTNTSIAPIHPTIATNTKAVDSVENKLNDGILPSNVVSELSAKCAELSTTRKARKGVSPDIPSKEAMQGLTQQSSYTPHKADSKMGITCIAVQSGFNIVSSSVNNSKSNNKRGASAIISDDSMDIVADVTETTVTLSGSMDKNVILTDLQTGKVLSKLVGHSKKINAVSFHPNASTLFSASADKTIRVWNDSNKSGKYSESWIYDDNINEITNITLHPTGNYMVSIALDAWHFLDINAQSCLSKQQGEASNNSQHSCGEFHPDGLILGSGTSNGLLRIWDVRTMQNVHVLEGHTASVSCLSFSENGYLAASGSEDGSVRLWDLRKLTSTKTLEVGNSKVNSVAFDNSGVFLAIGGGGSENGTNLSVMVVKEWSSVTNLTDAHSKSVTGVAWGSNASTLVSCSMDRTIKVFTLPSN